MSMVRIANILLLLFAISFTPVQPLHAQDFYKGQTIQIVVGFAAGGGFDSYSRTIARHMGKHIPGNPNLVVVNTTGAGSLIAANQVYRKAKSDGLTIGNFIGGAALNQILGLPGIEFDARKFRWIGVPVSQDGACALTAASGITSVATWQASKVPVKLGASAAGNVDYNMAKILKEVIALPVQVISGYKGTAETRLAAESGEIAGSCWQWQSIKATWKGALDAGRVVPVIQFGPKANPDIPNVPLGQSLAKSDEARIFLRTAVESPNVITIAYAAPPGTPDDRVQLLRRGFIETLKDPALLEDAKKSNLEINPLRGEETEKIIESFFSLDAKLLDKLRNIVVK
jgi:tripartite-type tricarboxylate transporter receptor subunit TctC